MIKGTVAVGYVHVNMVHEGFANSLAKMCLNPANKIVGIISTSNPRQEVARNHAIAEFLAGPAEWLMWIDTDMTFDIDSVQRLLATAKREKADAVTGLGFILKRAENAVIPNGYMWDQELAQFREIEQYPSGKAIPVDGTGAGFVLVHRKVFEAFRAQYGDTWHQTWLHHPSNDGPMGHDLAFFFEVTQNLGFKLVWDTAVKTGHIKHFELNEQSYEDFRRMQ